MCRHDQQTHTSCSTRGRDGVSTRAQTARTAAAACAALTAVRGEEVEQAHHVKTCFDFASMLEFTIPAARRWMDQLEQCVGTPPDSPTSLSEVGTPSHDAGSEPSNAFSAAELQMRLAEITDNTVPPAPAPEPSVSPSAFSSAFDCAASHISPAASSNSAEPTKPNDTTAHAHAAPFVDAPHRRGRASPTPTAKSLKRKHRSNPAHNNGQGGPVKKKSRTVTAQMDGSPCPRKPRKPKAPVAPGEQRPSNRRRANKRAQQRTEHDTHPWQKRHGVYYEKPHAFRILVCDEQGEIKFSVCSRGAYTGSRAKEKLVNRVLTESELKQLGFKKIPWDGIHTLLILDEEETIIVAFVPPPRDDDQRSAGDSSNTPRTFVSPPTAAPTLNNAPPRPADTPAAPTAMFHKAATFKAMCDALAEDFSDAQELNLPASSSDGRRGKFIAINFGISYGGGQKEPRTLSPPSAAVEYVDQLKENPDLRRLAAWQSEIFASYQPKAYHHVRCKMARLHAWRSSLRPPFPRSVYTTACVNCGPSTECCGHHDLTNYPGCPCCITALGEFDAERGGHCVLHGLRIYVPFPAGASCLLSSAGLMHGNTAIQPGENRYSFTQYCVGGLMRWVSYGCKPAGDIPMDVRAQLDEEEEEGWEAQYARFSKVWEVDDDRKWVREQEAKEGYEG